MKVSFQADEQKSIGHLHDDTIAERIYQNESAWCIGRELRYHAEVRPHRLVGMSDCSPCGCDERGDGAGGNAAEGGCRLVFAGI